MRPFLYQRAGGLAEAVQMTANRGGPIPPTMASSQFLAGGTTLLDLMKLDVMRPEVVVDINRLGPEGMRIERRDGELRLGAFVTMAVAGEHPEISRNYPVIALVALDAAVAIAGPGGARVIPFTLGGNVLQRTRCNYFRDPSWGACNKREPGTGCAALDGVNRKHAVLGVSDHCIASYPGDFAQAMPSCRPSRIRAQTDTAPPAVSA